MAKMIITFILMSLALFGSSQSASFQCEFSLNSLGTLGKIYQCLVQNAVNITSPEAAQVDSISGTHLAGYNNDNVERILLGKIQYFPRGINKFFRNLKAVAIYYSEMKEIHQSDLKDYPKLVVLWLIISNLEILEENLFEFNPNLEFIYFYKAKILHIDPNVFDKLTKLNQLYFTKNTCISMVATSPMEVQNVIKAAKAQCTNSDYSNLKQRVRNLENESKNINSEAFKEKLENLENEIKNSKFSNFFQDKLQGLKTVQTTTTTPKTTSTTIMETTTTEYPKI